MTKFDGRKEFSILPCVLDAGIPDQQSTLGVNQGVNLCFELAPGWRISGASQVQLDARQGQSFAKVYCFILHLELFIYDGLVKSPLVSDLGVIKPFDTLVPFNTRCSEHPIFPAVAASDFLRDHHQLNAGTELETEIQGPVKIWTVKGTETKAFSSIYQLVNPPSATRILPVMKLDASLPRNSTVEAISCVSPSRFWGVISVMTLKRSCFSYAGLVISVSI